jgi:hypothetical protein
MYYYSLQIKMGFKTNNTYATILLLLRVLFARERVYKPLPSNEMRDTRYQALA